jgi:GNAT superfamily N-acetyltransferase
MPEPLEIRPAHPEDARIVAELLDAFNIEFETPTPGIPFLTRRCGELIAAGEMTVLLAGEPAEGLAVLRFRPSIYSETVDAYLEELYVVPDRRGQGIGGALMDRAMSLARERGAGRMDINVDEEDVDARRFYERLGFRNYDPDGDPNERMFFYEREL